MSIKIDYLNKWTRDHFYRTSYSSMQHTNQVGTKNQAVPGYKGFIPNVKGENMFGRPFSAITRDAFQQKFEKKWNSSTRLQFKNPKHLDNPTFRDTQQENPKYKQSGFSQNNSTGDKKGWENHPVWQPKNKNTEYQSLRRMIEL